MAQRTTDALSIASRSRWTSKKSKFLEDLSDLVCRMDSTKFCQLHRSLKESSSFFLSSQKTWQLAAGCCCLALEALNKVHHSLTCPE